MASMRLTFLSVLFSLLISLAAANLHQAAANHPFASDGDAASNRMLLRRELPDFNGGQQQVGSSLRERSKDDHCVSLINHGTHFGVTMQVGTPNAGEKPQTFDVVADTGSDSIIVPSCVCVKMGRCDPRGHCFQGMNHSSTFKMDEQKRPDGKMRAVMIAFGSGPIQAIPATDNVTVGGITAFVEKGVLLMIDQQLRINSKFEGILGLGIPSDKSKDSNAGGGMSMQEETAKAAGPDGLAPAMSPNSNQNGPEPSGVKPKTDEKEKHLADKKDIEQLKGGFLQAAHIDRFSVCFNDGAKPGILRLGTPKVEDAMKSMGKVHWGLGLMGISIGDRQITGGGKVMSKPSLLEEKPLLCDPSNPPKVDSPQEPLAQAVGMPGGAGGAGMDPQMPGMDPELAGKGGGKGAGKIIRIIPGGSSSGGDEGADVVKQIIGAMGGKGEGKGGGKGEGGDDGADIMKQIIGAMGGKGEGKGGPSLGNGGSLSNGSGPIFGSGLIEEATALAPDQHPGSKTQAVERQTPCGAIPDTGSTAIMCPKEQCVSLFEGICDKWDRCANFSKRLGSLAQQWLKISKEWSNLTDIPIEALNDMIRPNLNALLLHVEEEQIRDGEIKPLDTSILQVSEHQTKQPSGGKVDASAAQQDHDQGEETMPAKVMSMLKTSAFMSLLDNCQEWMGKDKSKDGLDELPQINFLLKGEGSEPKNYPLSAYAYVNEMEVDEVERGRANLRELMPPEVMNRTAGKKKVCTPSFGAMTMNTRDHGPLWILGQPLFFQYNVNFDRQERTLALRPQSTCTTCAGQQTADAVQQAGPSQGASPSSFAEQWGRQEPRRPRLVTGAPRLPNIKHNGGVVDL